MRTSSSEPSAISCAQHFDRIVVVQAHVVGAVGGQRIQQPAHAGRVHFDADVVARRVLRGGEAQRLAIAEADLQHARRARGRRLRRSRAAAPV